VVVPALERAGARLRTLVAHEVVGSGRDLVTVEPATGGVPVVLKLLQERSELDSPHGRATTAMLIYQDLAVVPLMLLAPLLAGTGGGASALGAVGGLLLKVAGVGIFTVVAYRWVVPWLLRLVVATRSSEAFVLSVIALCVGIAMLTQSVGLSLALGAFIAGLIVSESDYSHQAVTLMLPFRDVFMSLFFVSIGMLLDLTYFAEHPAELLLLTLGVLAIKPLVAGLASLASGLPLRSSVLTGVSLGQVGEFSLVAATAGVSTGLLGADSFQKVLGVAVLSMVATPALMAAGPGITRLLEKTPLARLERPGLASPKAAGALDLTGHIVIVGFGVTGRNLAHTARLAEVPYAILELNAGTVREASDAGEPIFFGDATHEAILRHVNAERARAITVVIDDRLAARRIVELARRVAPDAFILVRTRYLREVEVLHGCGADEVIADEMEVSIEVFSRVLARMMVPREQIKSYIGEVRGDWRRMARTLAKDATAIHDLRVHAPGLTTRTVRLSRDSWLAGRSIAESKLRPDYGVTVLAITRDGHTTSHPASDEVFRAGDELFVVSPEEWESSTIA